MDIIHIKNLEVFGSHGVHEEERRLGQKFIINADLYTDFNKAASADDLVQTTNYSNVITMIADFVEQTEFLLIETVAQRLAESVLLKFENVNKIRVEIKKPWAPVKYPVETVSVEILRGWHTVYLSLGSNMGNREKYIENALNALRGSEKIRIGKISPFYETSPYGGVEQPDFLNNCVEIRTILEPELLLDVLSEIEKENGRERTVRWGPRTLDMDILLYDDLVMHTQKLSVPHTDMANRLFVLQPLNDIAPYAYHPVKHATVQELYNRILEKMKPEITDQKDVNEL